MFHLFGTSDFFVLFAIFTIRNDKIYNLLGHCIESFLLDYIGCPVMV